MEYIKMQTETPILTVSQLNEQVSFLLEKSFPSIWIEGEISNFSRPTSGHWYFVLKDQQAQVRCAMFRSQNLKILFKPEEGMQLRLKARVSLYAGRGDYQLIVEQMEEAGHGALQRQFELLKTKLSTAGLFAEEKKQLLPKFPKQIGIITSETGAALRDILHVLKRRMPAIPVIIYPTLVQGEKAAPNIVTALQTANQRKECDMLILARGGGSLEDLWPFNEEIVAYAIAESQLPIITGIGHQIDFTIADFVADLRAPTPSAAAEMATLDQQQLLQHIDQLKKQTVRSVIKQQQNLNQTLDWITKRLLQSHPLKQLNQKKETLQKLSVQLQAYQKQLFLQYQHQFEKTVGMLHAVSPLATLARGYAIAKRADNQTLIQQYNDIQENELATIAFDQFELECLVLKNQKKTQRHEKDAYVAKKRPPETVEKR